MIHPSMLHLTGLACLALVGSMVCCESPSEGGKPKPEGQAEGELLRVGSVSITQADLDYQLKEKHQGRSDEATRNQALDELAERARFSQAALDAGLEDDPVARAEIARILASRLREKVLNSKLKDAAGVIPEARLRELYESQSARFQAEEKRQFAVLWLDPGADPARKKQYEEKLAQARDWFFNQSDLAKQPDKGFSVLAVDYSEHAATRFKGGVLGWFERAGGSSDWTRAVSEIGFSLGEAGAVSPVVVRPEGVFLVRWMDQKPALQTPFEAVRATLEREERNRLRTRIEEQFKKDVESRYPVSGPQP